MKTSTSLTKSLAIIFLALITAGSMMSAATFTVTNTNDSGPGSLRQAVLDANAATTADTIVFDASFNTPKTITLASEIDLGPNANVTDILTIVGPGPNFLTISGNNAVRHFETTAGDTNSISGMTLANGNNAGSLGTPGGSINNSSTLSLTDVIFVQNTANTGGAIYSGGNGTTSGVLNIVSCTFTNNNTTGTNINGDGGSAMTINSGKVTITNSLMTGGTTLGGGGAIRNGGTMNISASTISTNTSGGAGNSDGGGGIYNSNDVTLTNCTINNNTSGEDTRGGGIRNAGTLTLIGSLVTENTATEGGGGIYASGSGASNNIVNIYHSTISNNEANTGTGSTTFGQAGGIYIGSGMTATITNSTISGNTVRLVDPLQFARQGNGGAIYTDGPLTLINSTVSDNLAESSYGGIQDSNPGGTSDIVIIINSTVANNRASGNVGGFGSSSVSDVGQQFVSNSIIADNIAGGGTSQDVFGSIGSLGYNIIGNTTGSTGFGTTGDQLNVDPLLDPAGLADHGGLTQTIALQANSPAIDKGKSADVMTDQRALLRPYDNLSIPNTAGGDGSDIGAFEDQPPNTSPGNDVTVEVPAGDATITFHSISGGGFTTFARIGLPSAIGPVPKGYTILDDAPAYDIKTTASFTAPLTVCLTVSSIDNEEDFARVRILHSENGVLVDRTILAPESPAPDFTTRTLCASVDSLSPFVVALAPVAPNTPVNISTRLQVLTDDKVLIGGFIIAGNEPKTIILRAIGPSLGAFGISDPLADPILELHAGDGSLIMSNDNWKMDQQDEIEATGLAPTNNLESATVATLDPGSYTAIVSGKNGGTGVGLVEAYDLDTAADSELANISTRGFVDTGNNVMIGGFILGGDTGGTSVLIRAIGPTLADFGVTGVLADPTLELHDAQGALLSSNDNWKDDQEAEIEATGLQPQKDLESALLETLPAGAYTAIVAGQGSTTGVGLVEVYRLP